MKMYYNATDVINVPTGSTVKAEVKLRLQIYLTKLRK